MPGESQETPKSGVPDPTVLTTEQLLREVDRVKELMNAELDGQRKLTEEKLRAVETQFGLVERQRVEQKKDTKDAVDAALAAAKEAVKEQTAASDKSITKSETATAEQLKQLTATFTTAIDGVRGTLDDLKERIGKSESLKQGGKDATAAMYAMAGFLVSLVVLGTVLAASGVLGGP